MTNEEAIKILKNEYMCRININSDCAPSGACMTCEYAEDNDDVTNAIGLAIEALRKQCASSEQVDKSVIVDFVAFQREWLNSHKTLELDAVNNALVNIFLRTTGKAFIDTLSQTAENDEAIRMDDQCGDNTEMIAIDLKKRTITERLIIAKSLIDSVIADSERVSLPEAEKSNSFSEEPSEDGNSEMNCSDEWWKNYIRARMRQDDVPDTNVGKTELTRYEPESNTDADLISRAEAIEALARMMPRSYTPDGSHPADEEVFKAQEIYADCIEALEILPSAQPKTVTNCHDLVNEPEIICDSDCEGFVCHKNGIYGWCPKAERWGCEYFYELERRNDG